MGVSRNRNDSWYRLRYKVTIARNDCGDHRRNVSWTGQRSAIMITHMCGGSSNRYNRLKGFGDKVSIRAYNTCSVRYLERPCSWMNFSVHILDYP